MSNKTSALNPICSVAWVTSGFAPYRVPLWNELNKIVKCEIVLLSEQESIRAWRMDRRKIEPNVTVLRGKHLFVAPLDWQLSFAFFSLWRELARVDPGAVVVSGYESPGFWMALIWAKLKGRAVVLHYGSTGLSTRAPHARLLNCLKRTFVRRCDAYFAYGTNAAKQLSLLGARPNRIVSGQNMSDISLTPTSSRMSGPSPSILFVGQLIPRKGAKELLIALALIKDLSWQCVLVGGGPERTLLEKIAADNDIAERVQFRGSLSSKQTSIEYRHHDILVFPSLREVWGLVVNEALLSGLFVIGSNRAASCVELIQEGLNGALIAPDSISIAAALRKALGGCLPDREVIRATATHITPRSQAEKLHRALLIAIASRVSVN